MPLTRHQSRRPTRPNPYLLEVDSIVTAYYASCVSSLAAGGVYCGYGITSKEAPGGLSLPAVLPAFAQISFRHSVLHGVFGAADACFYNVGDRREALPFDYASDLQSLVALSASGSLSFGITTHAFFELKTALLSIASFKHRGKQCVLVAPREEAAAPS